MAAWRKLAVGALALCGVAGMAAPARAADPKDDIVLGALVAEFHLAVAASLGDASGGETDIPKETLARAAQISRLTARHDSQGSADLDLALGAFLAFAAGLEKEAKAPLAPKQARDFACQLVGSDPVAFAELGRRVGIDGDGARSCTKTFEQAAAAWNKNFSAYRLGPGLMPPAGAGPLYVEIAPVFNPANEAIAAMLRDSQLYDLLAERLNAEMVMPSGRVLLVTECGGTHAFYNSERREIVLCDERIAAWIAATSAQP
jgi:hypothetical protein